jgi:drug/metabolite transporter (DMT)-like permease
MHLFVACTTQAVTTRQWAGLLTVALLQTAIARFAELYAIGAVDPDQIIPLTLTGRLEPPITFLLTRLIFSRLPQTGHAYFSNAVTVLGVLAALVFVPLIRRALSKTVDQPLPVLPVLLTLGATVLDGVGGGLSYLLLSKVPVGIYLVVRSAVGAVFFFLIAWALFGIDHFYGCWDAKVVAYMLAWSGLYILVGNVAWFAGVSWCNPLQISMVGAFYLPMSLVATWFLLQSKPTVGEWVGSGLILVAIVYAMLLKGATKHDGSKRASSGSGTDDDRPAWETWEPPDALRINSGQLEDERTPLLHAHADTTTEIVSNGSGGDEDLEADINVATEAEQYAAVKGLNALFAGSFLAKALMDDSGMFRSNLM